MVKVGCVVVWHVGAHASLVDDVAFRSVAHVQIRKDDVVISDFVAFVFTAFFDGGVEGRWYDTSVDECANLDLAPSVQEILETERVGDQGFHYIEVNVS